jgi:hypothetical protein
MSDSPYQQILLREPLSEDTRKERRNLLAISTIGIALVKTGLIPTKISALGIEFSQSNQRALLYILLAMIIYFFLTFAIYAISDVLNHWAQSHVSSMQYWSNQIKFHKESLDQVLAEHSEKAQSLRESLQRDTEKLEKFTDGIRTLVHTDLTKEKTEEVNDKFFEADQKLTSLFSRSAELEKQYIELEEKVKKRVEDITNDFDFGNKLLMSASKYRTKVE